MLVMMKQAIDVLKNKISSNLEEIKLNEQRFRKIMSYGDIKDNSDQMNKLLEENKALLSQNFDYLNLQLSMLKFLEKYNKHKIISTSIELEEVDKIHESLDIFYYTKQGSLPFNVVHPYIYDEYFWGELINYYQNNEKKDEIKQVLSTLMMSKLN